MAKYRVIDLKTGEETDTDNNLSFVFNNGKSKLEAYFMGFNLQIPAADKQLQGNDLRVLIYLCQKMEPGGWILHTQVKIAEVLEIDRSNVAHSIKRLVSRGYLVKETRQGRQSLRVDDKIAGKGSYAYRQAMKD